MVRAKLYNIENKNGSIKQLNRLLMGWNGMVAQGIQPTQATLVIPKCGPMLTPHRFGMEWLYADDAPGTDAENL